MFVHGLMPHAMMHNIVTPIIKDRNKDVTDYNNYRGIALAPISSKVLEFVILNRYEDILNTSPNQFGFKKSHGTEECVFALKEVINYYFDHSSPVFACFVDFSKAFDRVNHDILFSKLEQRGIPMFVIRVLCFWYSYQTLAIVWGNCTSVNYCVSNSVRQSGVLSPFLYNCYTDDLSKTLTSSNIGCHIDEICINHLLYADDVPIGVFNFRLTKAD